MRKKKYRKILAGLLFAAVLIGQYGGYKTVTFTIGAKSIGTIWSGIWNRIANCL